MDAYYEDQVFYVTSNSKSNKMRQIEKKPEVSIASFTEMFTASGRGENLGWVLEAKNAGLRNKLRTTFAPWYDKANNEKDYPDYVTQGETENDLKEHLLDLYRDLFSGELPYVRKVDELVITV